MKLRKSAAVSALVFLFIISACSDENANNLNFDTPDATVKAINIEGISSFDVDEDGCIYATVTAERGDFKSAQQLDGTQIELPIYTTTLYMIGMDGNVIESHEFDEELTPMNLTVDGDSMYYTAPKIVDGVEKQALMKYTFGSSSAEQIHTFENLNSIKKIERIGNTLFVLGLDLELRGIGENGIDGYYNSGECIVSVDLSTFVETVFIDSGVIDFSKTPSGNLLIYGHNDDGYYFTLWNSKKDSFSEDESSELGMLQCLCACSDEQYIFSSIESSNSGVGASMGLLGKSGQIDVFNSSLSIYGTAKFARNEIYYIESGIDSLNKGMIVHIDISKALKSDFNHEIKLICAEYTQTPSSQGLLMEQTTLDYESFALTVLSQDKNYDLCILNSRQDFAATIRDKGSFYPLNDIDGVSEYLDSFFPFIKDAATNADGDIWMLPVNISVNTLAYNSALCTAAGIDFSADINFGMFLDAVVELHEDENVAYYIGAEYYTELLLSDYLMHNDNFETAEFRTLAEIIKNKIFGNYEAFSIGSKMQTAYFTGDYSKVAFRIASYFSDHMLSAKSASYNTTTVPMYYESPNNIATCEFVCVNPASENLANTLEYISKLCKTMIEDENNLMLKDLTLYSSCEYFKDLYKVYENGVVRFSYSNELFLSDFYEYIDGNLSLDDFIAEADRKLAAYLNE